MPGITIAVCGATNPTEIEAARAEECGRLLARAGVIVVTGGGAGIMAAALRGAKSAGGTTLGILPGIEPADANPFVTVSVATGLGEARNAVIVTTADAVIAVGGEYGTLSEIALARKLGREVIGLGTWEIRRRGTMSTHVREAGSAAEAVPMAITAAKARRARPR